MISLPRAEAALRLIAAGCPDPVGTALAALGDPSATTTAVALIPDGPTSIGNQISAVISAWTEMAMQTGLPIVRAVTTSRTQKIKARLREHGLDAMLHGIREIGASNYCHGQNDSGWHADIDFFLRPDRCAKAIEGGYANRDAYVKPYKAGGLDLFMQSAKPGEDAGETYRRKMDELNDRAAGRLIDADEDDPDTAGLLDLEPSRQVVAVLWGIDP